MITIKRWTDNEVIYTSDCATIREAVEQAVREKIELSFADLQSTDLSNINLPSAKLFNAKLSYSTLKNTFLIGADLSFANLKGARIEDCNLSLADLSNTDLSFTELSNTDLSLTDLSFASFYWTKFNKIDLSKAVIYNSIIIKNLGPRKEPVVAIQTNTGIKIKSEIFFGTLDNFEITVKQNHQNNKYARDYFAMIEFIKKVFQ